MEKRKAKRRWGEKVLCQWELLPGQSLKFLEALSAGSLGPRLSS